MKNLITCLILVLSSFSLHAQNLANEVIAAAGESFSSSTLNWEWTLGEIMTESYVGTLVLTQGFHQAQNKTTSIKDLSSEFGTIKVYPNPTSGSISIETERIGNLLVELWDMRGGVLLRKNMATAMSRLDLTHLPTGIYVLRLSDGKHATRSIQIKKL